jgi:hypothetical protein
MMFRDQNGLHNICVRFADVTHIRRESGAWYAQNSRTMCFMLRAQGVLLLDPSVGRQKQEISSAENYFKYVMPDRR